MARADDAVAQLEAAMAEMRQSGQLQIFNRMYRVHRDAAGKRGRRVLTYRTALSRLQSALIPHLAGGKPPPVEGLFERVFG
jgi:hypothetical protein